MARLVINPGLPTAWEVQLKPGANCIGRGFSNDLKISDPSVSTSHCEIQFNDGVAVIRDNGSTNGTFVNRNRIQESSLQSGQTIHLGNVEMQFLSDAVPTSTAAKTAPVVVRIVGPGNKTTVAPTLAATASAAPRPVAALSTAPPPVIPAALAPAAVGSGVCQHHPKTQGRFWCAKCQLFFCELCVNSHAAGGVQRKFCRHCGGECAPTKVSAPSFQIPQEQSFFARLPGAFAFPFRGSGILVLIVGTVLFSVLNFAGGMGGLRLVAMMGMRGGIPVSWWGLMIQVTVLGYLFAYMQSIIHATAIGDKEMPTLPGMANFYEDVLLPFLELLGVCAFCFGPVILLAIVLVQTDSQTALAPVLLGAFILGILYFPMAFLAVAMLDTVMAANPLQVIPSIFKAPLEYVATLILLGTVFGVRALGDLALPMVFPRGLLTHSIPKMAAYLAAEALWALVCLYLLTVGMHILGLLYVTKKDKFGWLAR